MRELLGCAIGCLVSIVLIGPLWDEKVAMEQFYGNSDIDERISEAYEDDLVNERFTSYTAGTH